ncbi:MAG: EamA family transporter [Alphaproteobacteria bacterium]|nr:EamA family transporter [Alphaproteobacteria bacterium]
MSAWVLGLFSTTVLLDVVGQLLFKIGLSRLPAPMPSGWRFFAAIGASPAVIAGVAAYTVEAVLWLAVLQHAPLSLVFPLASLSYCGVVLAGRLVLGETVSRRRWLGAAVVTAGVAIVSWGGMS